MSANSVTFSINADASKGEANIKKFGSTVDSVSKSIQENFGKKLTQVISFAAIEEATRRTAEWAQEITQTSKALGVTAEQLQTLEIIASKTGTSQSATVDMFKNITAAAEQAIAGNADLITSFQALGVHISRTSKVGDVFGDVMNKIASLPGGLINNPNIMVRNAAAKITGQPENVVQTFAAGYAATPGGPGLGGKAAGMAGKDIASNADIQALASVWAEILTSLKESGKQLLPIATFLLSIVKGIVDAFGAITDTVGDTVNIVTGIISGDFDKALEGVKNIGRLLVNMFLGIGKAIGGIIDMVSNLVNKIPGLRGHFTPGIVKNLQETQNSFNNWIGSSQGRSERGQALGALLPSFITFGEQAAISGSGLLGKTLGKLGFKGSANKLEEFSKGMAAARVDSNLMSDAEMQEGLSKRIASTKRSYLETNNLEQAPSGTLSRRMANGQLEMLNPEDAQFAQNELKKIEEYWNETVRSRMMTSTKAAKSLRNGMVAAGVGQAGVLEAVNNPALAGASVPPGTESRLLPPINPLLQGVSSGGANLKIGGMFGAGEARIIRMTQKMIDLLGQIVMNTSPWNANGPARMTNNGGNGNITGQSGGL